MATVKMETYTSVPQQEFSQPQTLRNPTSPIRKKHVICAMIVIVSFGVALLLFFQYNAPANNKNSNKNNYKTLYKTTGKDYEKEDTKRRERFNVKHNEMRETFKTLENSTYPNVCMTAECNHSAAALLGSMDFTVDPCDDFYSFVCGKWHNDNESLFDVEINQFTTLNYKISNMTLDILKEPLDEKDPQSLNAAKEYFRNCVDLDQLEKDGLYPLYSTLEKYGGWPVLYNKWNHFKFDFIKSVSALLRIFSTQAIFEIRINKKSGNNVVEILQPSFPIPQEVLLNPAKYESVIKIYMLKITLMAVQINEFNKSSGLNKSTARNVTDIVDQVYEIIQFESKIAKAAKILQRDGETSVGVLEVPLKGLDNYFEIKPKTLDDLFRRYYPKQNILPSVPGVSLSLSELLRTVFRDSGTYLSENQLIRVVDIDYIREILKLLKETPEKTIANYLHYRMAYAMTSETTKAMRDVVSFKNTTINEREKTCSSFVEKNFGLAIGFKYIQNGLLSMDAKKEIQKMYEEITSSFKELLGTSRDWMPSFQHSKLINKIDTLRSCIGFPEWIENVTAIDVSYRRTDFFRTQYEVNKTSEFLKKHLLISEWQGNQQYKLISQAVNKDCNWAFEALVNAFYDSHRNSIDLPPGVLQFPLFDQNRPQSLNFGALGTIIGHELTHSYSSVDIDDLNSWKKHARFEASKKCLVDQYNNVESLTSFGPHENGQITFTENFADVGGLAAAYFSLIEHLNKSGLEDKVPGFEEYNSEQLFYISFAHNWCSSNGENNILKQIFGYHHSPPRQRVVGALRNSEEFSRAWNCPGDSNMNKYSLSKCDIF